MGRVRGKFFTNRYELKRQFRDIRQEQEDHGTTVDWYYFLGSVTDQTYDEGGRRWKGPKPMPVVSAVVVQGGNVSSDSGRFITDTIVLRLSWRQLTDHGVGPNISADFETHYSDRFVYREHVYSIENIAVHGHFDPDSHDVMVEVRGGQLRPDELVDDVEFLSFSSNYVSE